MLLLCLSCPYVLCKNGKINRGRAVSSSQVGNLGTGEGMWEGLKCGLCCVVGFLPHPAILGKTGWQRGHSLNTQES